MKHGALGALGGPGGPLGALGPGPGLALALALALAPGGRRPTYWGCGGGSPRPEAGGRLMVWGLPE